MAEASRLAETRVLRVRSAAYQAAGPLGRVYIGRPGLWGNPYVIGPDGDRAAVIAKYRAYVLQRDDLRRRLPSLRGKVLGCWCAPLPCHGDVLRELSDGPLGVQDRGRNP